MNDLRLIAFGSGLQDSFNPCIFMACAGAIIQESWLRKRLLGVAGFRIVFGSAYILSFVFLNFGPAPVFVFQKGFIIAVKIIYFILGLWSLGLGLLYFKDWDLMRRQASPEKLTGEKQNFAANHFVVILAAVISGLFLGTLTALGPINKYILLLGNEALLKGQWQTVMPVLGGYVLAGMWPLWFLWIFLSIKNVRPSLVKIVCSAIFFIASSIMVLIFK